MKSFLFVFRLVLGWLALLLFVLMLWSSIIGHPPGWLFGPVFLIMVTIAIVTGFSHVRRVRLITDRIDDASLANRHRRQIEIPLPAGEAYDMVEAAIRELPNVDFIESTRDSLQVLAHVKRTDPHLGVHLVRKQAAGATAGRRNQVRATVTPGSGTGSVTLICEPEGGAWLDWLLVDDGTNLENAEALTRAIARRVAERRKGEQASVRQTETEKELTVAKLSLLHAQVEPHFLYNTLASAQVLTRSDPARADRMLGYLITYLRRSLPRTEEAMSTLGEELERARAYLEILRIRMGDRLALQVQMPETLAGVALPPMMLQTLVENAIKHGLEPMTGGGTVWIIAREHDGIVSITVADDGRGFNAESAGTGIGLKNVRERLRLAYGDAASFSIVANFPKGVAATISVPPPGRREVPMPRCVIAEDEELLRNDLLAQLRSAWPELEVVSACDDGGAALEAIAEHRPDFAFLDIRMPGLTGLEVAAAAAEASPATQVVFVTAYNQYAIEAFDRGAVDYLLKPIAADRLAATVQRLKARSAAGPANTDALAGIIAQLRQSLPATSKQPPLVWITASAGKETRLILVEDVAYFRSDSKYTVVMTQEGEALVRTPIRELMEMLDPAIFKQIHRSTIVNLRAVAAITRDDSGRGTLRLKNRPETLPVSLTYMPLFRNM